MTGGLCSGFLVGPDLLVTAGHCIKNDFACKDNFWVFDFRAELTGTSKAPYFDSESVYRCKKVIAQKLVGTGADYALIQLDRKVRDREPLKVRTEGKVKDGKEIVVIGHPSGLPTIIAGGAIVRKNTNPDFFQSNLDTFGGNSGSAVFNAETGLVEGILVRGETDYRWDAEAKCRRVFQCDNDKCRGEDVTRITVIKELMKK
jgi:V8-like Glu-specific endopeptidase